MEVEMDHSVSKRCLLFQDKRKISHHSMSRQACSFNLMCDDVIEIEQLISINCDAFAIINSLGKGALMAKIAFCLIPVRPEDWSLLEICWKKKYYIDTYHLVFTLLCSFQSAFHSHPLILSKLSLIADMQASISEKRKQDLLSLLLSFKSRHKCTKQQLLSRIGKFSFACKVISEYS